MKGVEVDNTAPKLDKHVSALREQLEDLEDASQRRDWVTVEEAARVLLGTVSRILTRATTVRELQAEGVL